MKTGSVQFSCSVVSDSFATLWTAALQASLSITNSRSLLKLMSIVICYIAMSPVATGLHFLPTRALSHERRLRDAYISVRGISCKIAFKKQSSRSNLQEADLAERCDSSLPYFLFNCSLDFGCDG